MEHNGLIKAEQGIDFKSPEMVKVLKATVAAGLNDHEFVLFAEHCKATKLNPFKKEVWAIKGKGYTNRQGQYIEGKLQIMTGINGFVTIANSHKEYNGMECGLVTPEGELVSQAYPKNDFVGAWARVHRKDRQVPTESVVFLSEYDKSIDQNYPAGGIWRTMKRVMIQKCAKSVALREAFPQELNGLYTEEEMPIEYSAAAKAKEGKVIDVKPADVLGDDMVQGSIVDAPAKEPEYKFDYDLTSCPPEKLESAHKLLKKAGARTEDDLLMYWESPVMVTKLEDFRIKGA
jgi:phage recombination protein Bet